MGHVPADSDALDRRLSGTAIMPPEDSQGADRADGSGYVSGAGYVPSNHSGGGQDFPSVGFAYDLRQQPKPRPSIKPWRWLWPLGQMVMGGTVAVGLVMGIGVLRSGQQFLQALPTLFIPAVTEPEADVRTVVVQQLRGASELTTAIFAMEAIVPAQSDRTLAGYVIGSTNLLYIAYGEVRAGVDLSQMTVDNVELEGESAIRVTLPPPQILDSKLDVSKSTVYDYDRGWLGLGPDNAPQLQALAQQEALQKIEAAACTTGLLNEANRRAEVTVGQLLSTAGFESVTVDTQPAAACADPANSDTVIPGQN